MIVTTDGRFYLGCSRPTPCETKEEDEMGWNSPPDDGPNKVEPAQREVIEHKLLTALDDKDKVAVVLNESELLLLIRALGRMTSGVLTKDEQAELDDLVVGFEQLYNEAFDNDS